MYPIEMFPSFRSVVSASVALYILASICTNAKCETNLLFDEIDPTGLDLQSFDYVALNRNVMLKRAGNQKNRKSLRTSNATLNNRKKYDISSGDKTKRKNGGGRRGQRQRMNKNALRLLDGTSEPILSSGSYPALFNIAPGSIVAANITCGEHGREEFCKLIDAHPHKSWGTQCGICDAKSLDLEKRHPIQSVLDSSNSWWQSPTLQYGKQNEFVTITFDLGQAFEIFFIMIKSANSPRPASWILERSLENVTYTPWQYFGISDHDCRRRYNLPGYNGKYLFEKDDEVICTTQFSKPMPLENGEIHVSLVKNRPGALKQSPELMKFITARYIRIRFQGMHSTANADNSIGWLLDSQAMEKRSFYSLKLVRISGRLVCNGHAVQTIEMSRLDRDTEMLCECLHNTCGSNCEECCPLYNQLPFMKGTSDNDNVCQKCECFGHAISCYYDDDVAKNGESRDGKGMRYGGGVCRNCTGHTAGNNCEKCLPGYYRPVNSSLEDSCQECSCKVGRSKDECDSKTGECECLPGFTGRHCEFCVEGYAGESCTKCSCDVRGTMPGRQCEEHCQCRLHVEGPTCSECISGHFGLQESNPEGCLNCFCSGLGISCKSYEAEEIAIETLKGWTVSDITRLENVEPEIDKNTGNLVFGMYELPDVEAVFWQAPKVYTGNRLKTYASKISVSLSWIVVRGDTSGKATSGPNIILVGRNGLKIAYGDEIFHEKTYALIEILLTEVGWYHVPPTVKDIVTRLKRTEYRGDPVNRNQFMSVLSDLEAILIRGTFHTDQAESILERVVIYSGRSESNDTQQSLVEECICPPGYTGLSCESCDFGYIRVYEETIAHLTIAKCFPCAMCNGHAKSCNFKTGECGECDHNTFGERCESCKAGYYGNAYGGTTNDCKQCACPLAIEGNNFSPSCQLKKLSLDADLIEFYQGNSSLSEYVCTQCEIGYIGDHCEECDGGFYGNPLVIGSRCQPCSCDGGPCDRDTGECITCFGHTEGWRCERCIAGFWGDPKIGCESCSCYAEGSENDLCNQKTGQCLCKTNFVGLKCDECNLGFAELNLECPPCDCHHNGSLDQFCDPDNGQCSCKLNVDGLKCNMCDGGYFGLSEEGCEECNCHAPGSMTSNCDRQTGQCNCDPNVTGRRCEKCLIGFWNLTSPAGCQSCECDSTGSQSLECNPWTGQCDCRAGVGGQKCDECQEGFYGFSNSGCKPCPSCPTQGHVCDVLTGRCVCPPNSKGLDCKQCSSNTWGWSPKIGCQNCDCDQSGAIGQSCDSYTGQCICREGYAGRKCDVCSVGYYGYPSCYRCECNTHGSIAKKDGIIECDHYGQCPCKTLVIGQKCDQCPPGSFGLSKYNPEGCTNCFCFERSQQCEQSDLSWGHIRLSGARNLSAQHISPGMVPKQEYEYVVVTQMEGAQTHSEDAEIKIMNGLNLVPSSTGNVSIGAYTGFYEPLYFQLPPNFYGDKTTSYGGFLRFSLLTDEAAQVPLDWNVLRQFPLVRIHSHNRMIVDYYEPESGLRSMNETYVIPLRENYWKLYNTRQEVNRVMMMAALQNIKHIFLRAVTWADFREIVLHNVHLDTAIYLEGMTNIMAQGVEKCYCPNRFTGLSCQDPGNGFYRWRNHSHVETLILEDLIGRVVPCDCSGRSNECEKETGICLNCANFTGGNHCENCAEGFYGDPNFGGCRPCPCPETNRNFARGCTIWQGEVSCVCKPGYTGPLCERCMKGYFGKLDQVDGKCEPCDCNLDGIVSDECDEETGQCNCKVGITGRRCDRCELDRHIFDDRRCKICDNCTLTLLDFVDNIGDELTKGVTHIDLTGVPAPWIKLENLDGRLQILKDRLGDFFKTKERIETFDENAIDKLSSKSENALVLWGNQHSMAEKRQLAAAILHRENEILLREISESYTQIRTTIQDLNNYGTNSHHTNIPLALKTAKHYLDLIKQKGQSVKDFREISETARNYNDFYKETLDIVYDQLGELEKLMNRLKELNHRVGEGLLLADKAHLISSTADDINEHNRNYLFGLAQDYDDTVQFKSEITAFLNHSLVPSTEIAILMTKSGNEEILTDSSNIKQLSRMLNATSHEMTPALRDLRKHWIPKARRHSLQMMKKAMDYAKQFESTKDGAKAAVRASQAYQNIVDAIEIARKATIEAKERVKLAQEQLYPPFGVSVIERAHKSLKKSKELQKDAMYEMNKTRGLKDMLKVQEGKVDAIKSVVWQTGLHNNQITSASDKLNIKRTIDLLQNSIDTSSRVSEGMKEETRKTLGIKPDIEKLRRMFARLEPEWDTKLGAAEENVSQALSDIRLASKNLNKLETQSKRNHEVFQAWNNTISKQLQELRDKIAKAKHAAEGIKVSLESVDLSCERSYAATSIGLSTSNTIKITIALNQTKETSSPLIFIEGENRRFLALEIVKRKVRFVWNFGGKTGVLIHALEIEGRDPKYDDAWYHIEANRTLNIGSMLVRRMASNGVLDESTLKTGTTDAEFTRFFRTPSNRIWVGGVPDDYAARDLVAKRGLKVVIHQVYVDRKPLGVWNFVHQSGNCVGAMLGAEETSPTLMARYFNGEGYAEVKKSRPRPTRKNIFGLQMTFKTLDENALLFLAVDDKNNRSVSVTLNAGCIVFRIDYGDESKLEINTTKKYNTGKWVSIAAAREFAQKRGTENGSLKVNNEEPLTGSPTTPITSTMLPDLSKTQFYLGGVPPGFRSGTSKAPGADNRFMGCMMDVQINGETYDPLESTSYYGVEQSCKDLTYKAGFYGNGFVEFPSQSLRKKSNIAFVFRTLQPECLLLLSAYPPSTENDYDSKDIRGNYSISIIDGHIHVWMDNGRGEGVVRLESNVTVNDGEFHVINIVKSGRRIELMIDDDLQVAQNLLGSPSMVNMPKDAGGLYFGGAPNFDEYRQLAQTFQRFEGTIRDIVFNNRTIPFNEVRNLTGVHIGRNGPSMGTFNGLFDILMKTEPIGKSFTASPEGCLRVGSYSYEPNSFKFGDSENSHSELNIPIRHFWQKNFNIRFDFRSFYPNGVILVAPGIKEKQKHFVTLLLRDGHLTLIVRGRRREELKLPAKLNDGQWHQVAISCNDRKVTMSVEIGMTTGQRSSAQMKIPKKISASNTIYVGGIPDSSLSLPSELFIKLEAFKGCLRKMNINNATQDLAKPGKHFNVGQCFPRVEKGSYFPGDAYAIYKKNFQVGKYLELELEFRTSELNGVLLSVCEPVGFPAISVELFDGNVIMSCDLGDGNPFRVESQLEQKFALCDNKWHNISALYDYEQITLRIDSYSGIIALAQQNHGGRKVHTKSPLYIGGLPDVAPSGTLLSRENFKGCIRNVSIRNERRDWVDMEGLHNVLLSECLAVN